MTIIELHQNTAYTGLNLAEQPDTKSALLGLNTVKSVADSHPLIQTCKMASSDSGRSKQLLGGQLTSRLWRTCKNGDDTFFDTTPLVFYLLMRQWGKSSTIARLPPDDPAGLYNYTRFRERNQHLQDMVPSHRLQTDSVYYNRQTFARSSINRKILNLPSTA